MGSEGGQAFANTPSVKAGRYKGYIGFSGIELAYN